MKSAFISRKSHKWIALVAGIQAVLWMVSGAYMVTIDLDFIHGDPLVRNLEEPLPAELPALAPVGDLLDRYPAATALETVARQGTIFYILRGPETELLLDAESGQQLSPLNGERATELARHYYTGDGDAIRTVLLDEESERPTELQTRPLPLWQVTFDDAIATTFYVSPATGELVTRRHTFWRLFDFLWMLHIMDYDERADVNNNLLRVAAVIGSGMAISGIWLLFYAFKGRRRAAAGATRKLDREDRDGLVPKTS